ncbi:hypothetical protein DdX_12420 [Ditylenchus destructor]|uniref:Uncharacterized protein n=1 Tax=Ditylenchus destructor TaxID=166010 RepID=A0AAD4MXX9_9BILA|nr:hypothetical protein DdX_12420 [Ditylenchus destructor]
MPSLTNRLFSSTFRFFNRRELFLLSLIYRRFCEIIDNGFSTAPLAILGCDLNYSACPGLWLRSIDGLQDDGTKIVSQDFIAHLAAMKFIRFNACFVFEICSTSRTENALKPLKHIWEGRRLQIIYKDCAPSIEFVRDMTSASVLRVKCTFDDSTNAAVKEFFNGSCEKFMLHLNGGDSTHFQLPVAELANFLLKPVKDCESSDIPHRFFALDTFVDPKVEDREKLFAAMEEQFMNGKSRFGCVMFRWNIDNKPRELIRRVRNRNINQYLGLWSYGLDEYPLNFTITTSNAGTQS